MGVAALGLEVEDLLLLLLDLGLHAPLLMKHGAALLIELHAQSGEVIWRHTNTINLHSQRHSRTTFAHGRHIRERTDLIFDGVRDDHG